METRFSRTELLIGQANLKKLQASTVAIFGIGGVGSYVAEALARSGIGKLILIDADTIAISNLNRQIPALNETIGIAKVEAMKKRIQSINENCEVIALKEVYLPDTREQFFAIPIDYLVDAIDMVTAKIDLVVESTKRRIPIISSMGTGNKLDPTQFEIMDIYKTSVCPLAKVMRKELKARGIEKLKVVYSKEVPLKPQLAEEEAKATDNAEDNFFTKRRQTPGSIAFVPGAAGLIIASEVVKDLMK